MGLFDYVQAIIPSPISNIMINVTIKQIFLAIFGPGTFFLCRFTAVKGICVINRIKPISIAVISIIFISSVIYITS